MASGPKTSRLMTVYMADAVKKLIESITGCPVRVEPVTKYGYLVLRQIGDSQWEPV